jgi:hypothetical protein
MVLNIKHKMCPMLPALWHYFNNAIHVSLAPIKIIITGGSGPKSAIIWPTGPLQKPLASTGADAVRRDKRWLR